MFYYFFGGGRPPEVNFSYAPTVVSYPLAFTYSFAYATVSALAAWESGKLREYRIWYLAPTRSQYLVAARSLLAPIGLAWLMLSLPVTVALIETQTLPTVASLGPLFMAMVLSVAHAVIGFVVGSRIPALISVPIMATGTWVFVAFSAASPPFWLRHVSGQISSHLMFGEAIPSRVLLPPLIFAGGIALGVALIWSRNFHWIVRAGMAITVSIAGVSTSILLTDDWGHTPPLLTAQAPMKCAGSTPKVCLPEAMSQYLPKVRAEVKSTLGALNKAGVKSHPALVTDRVEDGRYQRRSTQNEWKVSFTQALLVNGNIRYRLGFEAISFDCEKPDVAISRSVRLWGASILGEADAERRRVAVENTPFDGQDEVEETVRDVLRMRQSQQSSWYYRNLAKACGG
ncbi:hypothetical protein ABZ490_46915 [Streptomyces sp. NPDC005811]|uniref:DUF7224 domain-containing protein n=1 Tax=Streptomyces sp. NPDC005811 TaxID=3154565 RepID=UPI0033D6CCAD